MRRNTSAPLSDGRRSTRPHQAALIFAALAFVALASVETAAQTDELAAPPPLRYVPEDGRRQLDAESRDVKERVKLSLQLAEDRLNRAAAAADADRFETATAELGVYDAIV